MTEETEIPEVCKRYDAIQSELSKLESEIEEYEENIKSNIETVKEYLQIVKNAEEVNVQVDYFKNRLNELNDAMIREDQIMSKNIEKHDQLIEELATIEKEILDWGWWKVQAFLCSPVWHPIDKARVVLNQFGSSRIV